MNYLQLWTRTQFGHIISLFDHILCLPGDIHNRIEYVHEHIPLCVHDINIVLEASSNMVDPRKYSVDPNCVLHRTLRAFLACHALLYGDRLSSDNHEPCSKYLHRYESEEVDRVQPFPS